VGATTASTGAFTTLAYTGTLTGGTGVINIGSGQLYKDASGNVGIGTSSPDNNLEVASSAEVPAIAVRASGITRRPAVYLMRGTSGVFGEQGRDFRIQNDLGALTFSDGISSAVNERMRIDSAGNVGIGTSSPAYRLDVQSSTATTTTLLALTTTANYGYDLNIDFRKPLTAGGAVGDAGRIQSGFDSSNNYNLKFFTTGSGTLAERLRITSAGNVGIGTSSPAVRLSFGGYVPSNGQTLHIYQSSTIRSGLGVVSGVYRIFTDSGSAMSFGQVSTSDGSTYTERARIDSSGNLLVGTTVAVPNAQIQANTGMAVGGISYRTFGKSLGLSDNVLATYMTVAIPTVTAFDDSVNVGMEIPYVIGTNRRTSGRGSQSTYGKVYIAIARHWESDANAPVTVTLVDTNKALATAKSGGSDPVITWSVTQDAGTDNAAKNVYIEITVDNPLTGTVSTGIAGVAHYHTRLGSNGDISIS
jgi:hypothetical protein